VGERGWEEGINRQAVSKSEFQESGREPRQRDRDFREGKFSETRRKFFEKRNTMQISIFRKEVEM
jgi:hypothetical protein